MISLTFRIVLVLISFPVIIFSKSFSTFVDEHHTAQGGKQHWCGTPLVNNYNSYINRSGGASFAKSSIIQKTALTRANLTHTYSNSGSDFVIHYSISGLDSVNIADTNLNSIPDYIDEIATVLDSSYKKVVLEYGFKDPFDSVSTIDIYVGNIPSGYYAFTYYDFTIDIRNNYDGFPFGYDSMPELAIRVTLAHEFFHLVQFLYDVDSRLFNEPHVSYAGFPYIYEASAVWMEDEVYPQINDYIQYLPTFYNNIDKSLLKSNNNVEYSRCLWVEFLEKTEGVDIIRKIWKNMENSSSLYNCMDSTLMGVGGNLLSSYSTFAKWCYFVGGIV